jgi:hypothetical protein
MTFSLPGIDIIDDIVSFIISIDSAFRKSRHNFEKKIEVF